MQVDWKAISAQVYENLCEGRVSEAFRLADQAAAEAELDPWLSDHLRLISGELYNTHKDIDGYIALSAERMKRLQTAIENASVEKHDAIVAAIGGTNYNLASNTWPGWDEPGISIAPEHLGIGMVASQRCLHVRQKYPDIAFRYTVSMAHWVVGAHLLAASRCDEAAAQFAKATEACPQLSSERLMANGYLALSQLLAHPYDRACIAHYDAALDSLKAATGDGDAIFYRDQILVARRVLGSEGS